MLNLKKTYLPKPIILLLVVVFFGFFLRIVSISKMPPSLNWDEVSHGYNAYSLLKTGSDEWGDLPLLNFRAYGDYPLPLNLYLTIPFIGLLGLNDFSIRLPHAILGTLTIAASYFLAFGITNNKKIGLLTAFFLAIDPWHLFTSRFVVQSNLSVFFLVAAMALFFNKEKNKLFLSISLILLFLTLFSYHTTRIFSPLFLLSIIAVYKSEIFSPFNTVLVATFFVLVSLIFFSPMSRARSNFVFLVDQGAVNRIIEARNKSTLPFVLNRLRNNRLTYFLGKFTRNYFDYFSPNFLFLKGGSQYQFSVPGFGLLYLINLPFFYLGLWSLVKKGLLLHKKKHLVLSAWFLLAPIPASLTLERYAVLRSTTLLPLPELFVAAGIWEVINWDKLKIGKSFILVKVLYFLIIFASLSIYLNKYFLEYKSKYSWAWQYGYREVVNLIKDKYAKYDKIVITKKYGEPHEFILFYLQWDPNKYKNDPNLVRFNQSDWYWVDSFDKFYFVNDWDIPKDGYIFKTESNIKIDCGELRCLLVTGENSYPSWNKVTDINFFDGKRAFEIYEN